MMTVGIFGGSFNPVHNGHLAVAEAMLRALHLDEVWLMVSPQNPLKHRADLAPEDERYRRVADAVRGRKGLRASDFEFRLPRPSYTWGTLRALRKTYPDTRFTLIIGGDNWRDFRRWAHTDDILRTTPVAIYPRDGYPAPDTPLPQGVARVEVPELPISSTMIRHMIAKGEDITPYVP